MQRAPPSVSVVRAPHKMCTLHTCWLLIRSSHSKGLSLSNCLPFSEAPLLKLVCGAQLGRFVGGARGGGVYTHLLRAPAMEGPHLNSLIRFCLHIFLGGICNDCNLGCLCFFAKRELFMAVGFWRLSWTEVLLDSENDSQPSWTSYGLCSEYPLLHTVPCLSPSCSSDHFLLEASGEWRASGE